MAELGIEPRDRVCAFNDPPTLYQNQQFILTRWFKEEFAGKVLFWAEWDEIEWVEGHFQFKEQHQQRHKGVHNLVFVE